MRSVVTGLARRWVGSAAALCMFGCGPLLCALPVAAQPTAASVPQPDAASQTPVVEPQGPVPAATPAASSEPTPPSAAPDTGIAVTLPPPTAAVEAAPSTPPSVSAPVAPGAAARAARAARAKLPGPATPAHDPEHAPPAVSEAGFAPHFTIRLNLGAQAGFIHLVGFPGVPSGSRLRRPSFASLDLGCGILPKISVLVRIASWISYNPYAVQFLGAGVDFRFSRDGMYLTGLVGAAVLNKRFGLPGGSGAKLQGLALQLDLGQRWPLASVFDFGIAAHFELGTPLFGHLVDATGFGAGLVASVGY